MKLKILLPTILLLGLVTFYNYQEVKEYYDILYTQGGSSQLDFHAQLMNENKRASEAKIEYQQLLQEQEEDQGSDIIQEPIHLKLNARGALLMDAENQRVLYEVKGYEKMPMASTTKIMTLIVALENGHLDDVVTISSNAARQPDVQLNARTGEQYKLRDLLYALMLESYNDVAVAIAEHVGGSVEGFAILMNDKARSLGCYDTNFITPSGLDAEGHYTTPRDLAVIASYALTKEDFIKITNTPAHSFQELMNKRSFHVSNKNRFLYMMDGAIGMKTGFTNGAGYCFVGAVKKTDRTLVSVVLGCGWPPHKNLKWTDTTTLMKYGINHFEKKQIFRYDPLDPVPIEDGKERFVPLQMEGDITLLMSPRDQVDIVYDIQPTIQAPVEKGTIVGYARYHINGVYLKEIPIYAADSIDKIDFKYCLQQLVHLFALKK